MAVREDCRHYSTRTTPPARSCSAAASTWPRPRPFACPEHCLFFEPRSITDAGWQRFDRPDDDPTET